MRSRLFLLVLILIFGVGCIVEDNSEATITAFFLYKIDGTKGTGKLYINDKLVGSGTGKIEVNKFEVNADYSIRCEMEGTHDQWTILRHTLYGQNIIQKDTTMTELIYTNSSFYDGNDIYLMKIPSNWNMSLYGKYLDPQGDGMEAFGNRIDVVIEKIFTDGNMAEDIIKTFVEESENAQIVGDFTEPRRKYSLQYSGNYKQIYMTLKNIKSWQSVITYGQDEDGRILHSLISIPGSNRQSDTFNTLKFWIYGHIADDPTKMINRESLIQFTTQPNEKSKFKFTDFMKKYWILCSQLDTGIRF